MVNLKHELISSKFRVKHQNSHHQSLSATSYDVRAHCVSKDLIKPVFFASFFNSNGMFA